MALPIQHLSLIKLVFGDLKQFSQLWWVDLLVFHSDQNCCDAQDVQVWFFYLLAVEELINQKNRDVQRLRQKSELSVNIDHPLNQEGSWRVLDFSWQLNLLQIVVWEHKSLFILSHRCKNLLGIPSHELGWQAGHLICEGHIAECLLLECLQTLLEFFLDIFLWLISLLQDFLWFLLRLFIEIITFWDFFHIEEVLLKVLILCIRFWRWTSCRREPSII